MHLRFSRAAAEKGSQELDRAAPQPVQQSSTQSKVCQTSAASNSFQFCPVWVPYLSHAPAGPAKQQAANKQTKPKQNSAAPLPTVSAAAKPAITSLEPEPAPEDALVSTVAQAKMTPKAKAQLLQPGPRRTAMAMTGGAEEGLPRCHADSLQIVCLTGLLSTMQGDADWRQVQQGTFEACVWTFAQEAFQIMETHICAEEPHVHNLPALEQHIAFICKLR